MQRYGQLSKVYTEMVASVILPTYVCHPNHNNYVDFMFRLRSDLT